MQLRSSQDFPRKLKEWLSQIDLLYKKAMLIHIFCIRVYKGGQTTNRFELEPPSFTSISLDSVYTCYEIYFLKAVSDTKNSSYF